ncbi:hypothetical protein FB45DRAFT_999935 [Roridomyces roridus]|uniref:Decapping nuclease n=1 Tax=Roridomyces roridus TaxID=1738132 RepID=A0AAD7C7A6_9AGAR|nr:hypothetical protein FB45DRAFT_999935 [Roridomyces roridus]
MSTSAHAPARLIDFSDPPQCLLPALLGSPTQAACFSMCNGQLRVDSTAALRYFVHPPANADVKSGYNKLTHKQRSTVVTGLEDILAMCVKSKNSESLLDVQVIARRGVVKKMMIGEKMQLNVSFHNGILYIEEQGPRKRYIDLESYRGYRFETWCSSATPQGPSGGTVNLQTQFSTAVVRKIGSLKVLLVGEVDCVEPAYFQNPGPEHYVELKMRTFKPDRARRGPEEKWAIQTLLLGGSKLFVGHANKEDGVLQDVEMLSVPAVPSAAHQWKIDWGARVLHSLIEYCGKAQQDDGTLKVWRVELGKWYADIRELGSAEERALNHARRGGASGSRNGILPLYFIEELRRKRS